MTLLRGYVLNSYFKLLSRFLHYLNYCFVVMTIWYMLWLLIKSWEPNSPIVVPEKGKMTEGSVMQNKLSSKTTFKISLIVRDRSRVANQDFLFEQKLLPKIFKMTTSSEISRKRGYCTQKTLKEEATMEWTINDFEAWAESKPLGSSYNSSTFRFQFNSIKKNYNFNISIYPRGNEDNADLEDQIGVFLNSPNKVCFVFQLKS